MAAAQTYLWILIFVATSWRIQGAPEFSCNFEEGLCDWYNNGTTEMQWRLGSGQTDDRTSGPLNDHTCNSATGRYLYIAGEDAVDRASVAVIQSDVISLSKESHFSFWYHMNGFATGNLTLYRIHDNTSTPLWSRSGRQGKTWTQGSVTLTPGRLALRFEATVKLPIGSDLVLDDLDLSSEHHEVNKSHCIIPSTGKPSSTSYFRTGSSTSRRDNSSLTTASSQETTGSSNTAHTTRQSSEPTTVAVVTSGPPCFDLLDNPVVLPGTCDFENGTCGIHVVGNDSDTSISWNRTNQQHEGSLILGDHTFLEEPGRGYYMDFFKGKAFFFLNSQSTANLETPVLVSELICLSFWYSAPNQYSNLRVLVRGEDGNEKEIWNVADEGRPEVSGWHKAEVQVTESYPFTIVFQSQKNYFAVVGIDDIVIQGRGSTSNSSTSVEPKPPLSSMSPLASKVTPKLHTTSSTANVLSTNGETLSSIATNMPLSTSKLPTSLVLSTIRTVKTLSTVEGQSSTTGILPTSTVTEAATASPTFSTITSRTLSTTSALVTSTPPQFRSSSTATGQSSSTGIMLATTVTKTVTAAPTFSTTISRTLSTSTASERSSQVFTVTSTNTSSSLFTSQTSSGLEYNATVTTDFVPIEMNVTTTSVSTTTSKPMKTTKLPDGTKKPDQSTKNPLKTPGGKSEEQTGEDSDDNKHVTVIVGFSVGGAVTVVLILVIVYVIARCLVASRRSRKLAKGGQLMSNFGSSNTEKGRQLDYSAERQMEQIGHDKDTFCMYNNHLNGNINQNCNGPKAASETHSNGAVPSEFETSRPNSFDNALITRL